MSDESDWLYDQMTVFLDEGREMNIINLEFSKAFDAVSHNILVPTLGCYCLDE